MLRWIDDSRNGDGGRMDELVPWFLFIDFVIVVYDTL